MVHFKIEQQLKKKGFKYIAGVDEAGRGPLAGPVVAAAVILPLGIRIKDLDDSKKISSKTRERLYKIIISKAMAVGIAAISEKEIDNTNILKATFTAMGKAINKLKICPDHLIVDGNKKIPYIDISQTDVVGGDGISASVAAASIVAKVFRDKYMAKLHKKYPEYGFCRHKGYGTKAHMEAIKRHGPCPAHRKTFAPISSCAVM